jgi:hypothetical protein
MEQTKILEALSSGRCAICFLLQEDEKVSYVRAVEKITCREGIRF